MYHSLSFNPAQGHFNSSLFNRSLYSQEQSPAFGSATKTAQPRTRVCVESAGIVEHDAPPRKVERRKPFQGLLFGPECLKNALTSNDGRLHAKGLEQRLKRVFSNQKTEQWFEEAPKPRAKKKPAVETAKPTYNEPVDIKNTPQKRLPMIYWPISKVGSPMWYQEQALKNREMPTLEAAQRHTSRHTQPLTRQERLRQDRLETENPWRFMHPADKSNAIQGWSGLDSDDFDD